MSTVSTMLLRFRQPATPRVQGQLRTVSLGRLPQLAVHLTDGCTLRSILPVLGRNIMEISRRGRRKTGSRCKDRKSTAGVRLRAVLIPMPRVHRRGFTLIELMVVIALIGILTAMILPEMDGTYQDAVLRASARKLVSACNLASSRAIALGRLHEIRWDRKTGRYSVEAARPAAGATEAAIVPRDIPGGRGEIDRRITLQIRRPGDDPAQESPRVLNRDEGAAIGAVTDEGDGHSVSVEAGKNEEDEGIMLRFQPDGTADSADVVLRDGHGFGLALRINPITARVRIVELGKE